MKKERASVSVPPDKPDICPASKIAGLSAPVIYRAANGAAIDFHSPEFNITDDLNDISGDYRFFEPLDGIVTSDMRHQMERLHAEECEDAPAHETPAARKKERKAKRDETKAPEDTSPLIVISEGRTLIIDTDVVRAGKCADILSEEQLTCTLVVTRRTAQDAPLSWFDRLTLIEADDVSISGAFGGFSATVSVNGEQRPLAGGFDLVLDLRPAPSFAGTRLPLGYYAPGINQERLNRAMAEVSEMRGRFRKPHFMTFLRSRCFHGRSRTLDCRRCVDVCPFGAIRSEGSRISINHYLCQGCGGCALVCPADAITQVHPSPEELLNILRRRLAERETGPSFPMTVVISDGGAASIDSLSREGGTIDGLTVNFKVEEIGHVGVEAILTAFSHSTDNVIVACDSGNPRSIADAVAWQAEMACAILKGFDMPVDKCRFVVAADESPFDEETPKTADLDEEAYEAPELSREPSTGQARSARIRQAVQHLYDTSGCRKPWIPLPAGSPFGGVAVDPSACTLCMACVAACPSGALSAGGDVPRLLFVESRCHQCGLCRETCPEHAVQLIPRMMCGAEQVETPVVLCEAEVSRCLKCNAPFATRQMVNRMTEKLKSHWMYANERQLQRLKMCRVCRTRDALASEDMRLWNR